MHLRPPCLAERRSECLSICASTDQPSDRSVLGLHSGSEEVRVSGQHSIKRNADVLSSNSVYLYTTGPVAQECTVGNIVRSTLIVVVVVALGIVLAVEWKKWPRLRTR